MFGHKTQALINYTKIALHIIKKFLQAQAAVSLPPPEAAKPNPIDRAISLLTNAEIVSRVESGSIPQYKLESELNDCTRAVEIRRQVLGIYRAPFLLSTSPTYTITNN